MLIVRFYLPCGYSANTSRSKYEMMDSENEDYSGGENVTGLIWAVIVLFVDTTKFTYCFKVDSNIVSMLACC